MNTGGRHVAEGHRHGIVAPAVRVPQGRWLPSRVVNVAVEHRHALGEWTTASGGIAFDEVAAHEAAVGEALERWAAASTQLDEAQATTPRIDAADFTLHSAEQRNQPRFPYVNAYDVGMPYVEVVDAFTGALAAVPRPLVLFDERGDGISTSTGLAAGPTRAHAMLRAVQELVERDALANAWLHGYSPTPVACAHVDSMLSECSGDVHVFDLTPQYSAHPVVVVAGSVQDRGEPRISLGAACRADWRDAAEKAALEFMQGVAFASAYLERGPHETLASAQDASSFDSHAVYYSKFPSQWPAVPLMKHAHESPLACGCSNAQRVSASANGELTGLLRSIEAAGIRLYYRDITSVDAHDVGVTVVRALSPDLTPLHGDHRWPYLGGRTSAARRRFDPQSCGAEFPNKYPHPMG